ncbi:MAG: DNA-directed RNA polymerase subunit alpha [Planctomycetes bacterium]|nr:DNA-directed RNA polymerase subunit alpha [Planctomycetota bacterium]
MRIRWKGFELPTRVSVEESSKTDTYAKFTVEPFERGYGITIGNSLRRVLLSSLLGTAPVSMRIDGADHEFASIPGIVEDVINIALNVKGLLVNFEGDGPEILKVEKSEPGPVTGADFVGGPGVEVLSKDLVIATIEEAKKPFRMEVEVRKGRGYVRTEDFTWPIDNEVGLIHLDAGFSPVRRVRWRVEETRVGKRTNYDRLVLEIWTDGIVTPEDAMVEASSILRKHLNPFVKYYELGKELEREAPGEDVAEDSSTVDKELIDKVSQPVSILDPSVRAANCLSAEGIKTIGDLVRRNEADMLQVRNFGKTSLKEIKIKLSEMGLSFGMKID